MVNPFRYFRTLHYGPTSLWWRKAPTGDPENPPESAPATSATTVNQTYNPPAATEISANQRPQYKDLRRTSSFGPKSPAYRPRAPNMSLNISPNQKRADFELHCAAILGIFCQCAVLVVAALLSYYAPWSQGKFLGASKRSKAYAFPLTAAGCLAVFFGLFLCTTVVESASSEKKWEYNRHMSSDSDGSTGTNGEFSSLKAPEVSKSMKTEQDESEFGDIRCMWVQVCFATGCSLGMDSN